MTAYVFLCRTNDVSKLNYDMIHQDGVSDLPENVRRYEDFLRSLVVVAHFHSELSAAKYCKDNHLVTETWKDKDEKLYSFYFALNMVIKFRRVIKFIYLTPILADGELAKNCVAFSGKLTVPADLDFEIRLRLGVESPSSTHSPLSSHFPDLSDSVSADDGEKSQGGISGINSRVLDQLVKERPTRLSIDFRAKVFGKKERRSDELVMTTPSPVEAITTGSHYNLEAASHEPKSESKHRCCCFRK